ncbi:hypothetical protein FIBSPDRAFT_900785 [Athelia psychrophila]|uniref:Uncharacterized protein n=1 Tax=Athelia psychrophila TaxID=1759441 RepID=A0A165Y058_9AGAM|nr:hypothetical protein FIBSPDRAFT_900785 [Fibularhizoctonia sp. CBS 109695]
MEAFVTVEKAVRSSGECKMNERLTGCTENGRHSRQQLDRKLITVQQLLQHSINHAQLLLPATILAGRPGNGPGLAWQVPGDGWLTRKGGPKWIWWLIKWDCHHLPIDPGDGSGYGWALYWDVLIWSGIFRRIRIWNPFWDWVPVATVTGDSGG